MLRLQYQTKRRGAEAAENRREKSFAEYTKVKVVLRFSNFKNSPKSSLKKREDLKVESQNHFGHSIVTIF